MSTVKRIKIEDTMWQDERGWGLNPFVSCHFIPERLCDIHIVSMKPGAVRGNHCHTSGTEWMLICSGAVRFLWKADKKKIVNEIMIRDNEPVLLEIPPRAEHALRNEGEHEVYLIVMNSSFDPDTVRCPSLFELKR